MALITTEVRTCAELKYELENHSVDDTTFNSRMTCRIMNDLDFNEEGFWYHPDSIFLDMALNRNYMGQQGAQRTYIIDGGRYEEDPVTHAQVLVGNNALTNIYTYPNSVFMRPSLMGNNYCIGLTIKNLDFEAVMNQSVLFNGTSGWGPVIFENCNFNLKIVGYPKSSINGQMNAAMFYYSCSGSQTSANSGHLRFVNCTFNVEIVSSPERKFMGLMTGQGSLSYAGISAAVVVDACEFRIKNMTNDCGFCIYGNGSSFSPAPASGDSINIYINNCAHFLNNYLYEVNANNYFYLENNNVSSYKTTIMNSFVAAFADTADGTIDAAYRSKLICKSDYATAFFYDSDRIVHEFSGNNSEKGNPHIALTTAECKSENKLREIGFLFATES